MEKFVTNKGKLGIIYQGFQYRYFRESKVAKTWRCTRKNCTANCTTDLQDLMVLDGRFEHSHEEPENRTIQRQKIRDSCKRKAEEEPGERPAKIIMSEIGKAESEELLPSDVKSVRQAIYRRRRKTQPKLPQSRDESHAVLEEYEVISSQNENMIKANNTETKIIMFATDSNLRFLCQDNVHLFGDGTFQYCPKFFYQLYTIHVFKNGQYVPCVFFLLPEKSKQCYINMFTHLKSACSEIGCNLNITYLHLDFEMAVHEAARSIWQTVTIKACQFHLGQAWYRKIQSLGLSNEYKDPESNLGKWLKLFFGLSYLEPADVSDCFAFDILPEAPDNEKAIEFADYVLNTYVDETSKFPSIIWADPDLNSKRTTNGCESFHKQLSTMFYSSHPNVFDFMEKLKCVQTNNYLKMRASQNELPLDKKEKDKIIKMREIQMQFSGGAMERADYVRKMAYKNLPVVKL